jgi:hypothetical protein
MPIFRLSGAVPPRPHTSFMAAQEQLYLYLLQTIFPSRKNYFLNKTLSARLIICLWLASGQISFMQPMLALLTTHFHITKI